MNGLEKDMKMAEQIALAVKTRGGTAYFVGGYVRDRLLGIETKDIDIEIHGVTPDVLTEILDGLGERLSMGESFGIFGLKGYTLDIAMPRKEKVRGKGHRDFDMFVEPMIGTEKAAMRRDFTVNAMMMDVLTGAIIDHFGGREDLEKRILRHVSRETFAEDALRVLRGAQFAARFDFAVAEETEKICKDISLSALSKERVEAELKKALLKADRPSVFFTFLRKTGRLSEWFSELEDLIDVPQNPKYHAEGDVWSHTMMVLDAAARYREKASDPFGFMLTALTHDFGKAVCTEVIKGKICSYNHETKGLPLIHAFLHRITSETKLIRYVLNLAEYHMRPNALAAQGSSVKATNKMFDSVFCPDDLLLIAAADHEGRIVMEEAQDHTPFLQERLAVYKEIMARPYVMGRDLIAAGLKPNEKFTEILAYAHKLRLAGAEKSDALKQTLIYAEKIKK